MSCPALCLWCLAVFQKGIQAWTLLPLYPNKEQLFPTCPKHAQIWMLKHETLIAESAIFKAVPALHSPF